MPQHVAILAGAQLLAIMGSMESELDALIADNAGFGKWYFEQSHESWEPSKAMDEYLRYVEHVNSSNKNYAFMTKMIMRNHGWDDEYFEREPARLKNIAYEMNGVRHGTGQLDHTKSMIEGNFMQMLPYDLTRDYREALRHNNMYMRAIYGDSWDGDLASAPL